MAIEGNLKTMSMASLVQAICLEERNATLTLKRGGEEGVIFFDRGEIAHATLGSLIGEDAVYELVTWTEGSFRVRDYTVLPRRTIEASWNRLLMEGLRRTDEQQAETMFHACVKKALTPAETEHDRTLENDLIILLSKLEHIHANLLTDNKRGRADPVPQTLYKMIDAVNDFARSIPSTESNEDDLVTKLSEVDDFTFTDKQASRDRWDDLARSHGNESVSENATHKITPSELVSRAFTTLEVYFSFFSGKFVSSLVADRWIEASTVFLQDLAKTIEGIRF